MSIWLKIAGILVLAIGSATAIALVAGTDSGPTTTEEPLRLSTPRPLPTFTPQETATPAPQATAAPARRAVTAATPTPTPDLRELGTPNPDFGQRLRPDDDEDDDVDEEPSPSPTDSSET